MHVNQEQLGEINTEARLWETVGALLLTQIFQTTKEKSLGRIQIYGFVKCFASALD